jgi:hypothetical protein
MMTNQVCRGCSNVVLVSFFAGGGVVLYVISVSERKKRLRLSALIEKKPKDEIHWASL